MVICKSADSGKANLYPNRGVIFLGHGSNYRECNLNSLILGGDNCRPSTSLLQLSSQWFSSPQMSATPSIRPSGLLNIVDYMPGGKGFPARITGAEHIFQPQSRSEDGKAELLSCRLWKSLPTNCKRCARQRAFEIDKELAWQTKLEKRQN